MSERADEAVRPALGEATLGDRFLQVTRLLRRDFAETFQPYGITPHQARALRVAVATGPLRLGALAEQLRIAPRSATDVVDGLEGLGLIARTPDPTDRRATVVDATDEGRRLSELVESGRREHAEHFFGRLSEQDRRELDRLLAQLLA